MYTGARARKYTSKGRGLTKGKNTTVLSRNALLALVTWIKSHEQTEKDSQLHQNSSIFMEQGTSYSSEKTCRQTGTVATPTKTSGNAEEGVAR